MVYYMVKNDETGQLLLATVDRDLAMDVWEAEMRAGWYVSMIEKETSVAAKAK